MIAQKVIQKLIDLNDDQACLNIRILSEKVRDKLMIKFLSLSINSYIHSFIHLFIYSFIYWFLYFSSFHQYHLPYLFIYCPSNIVGQTFEILLVRENV